MVYTWFSSPPMPLIYISPALIKHLYIQHFEHIIYIYNNMLYDVAMPHRHKLHNYKCLRKENGHARALYMAQVVHFISQPLTNTMLL